MSDVRTSRNESSVRQLHAYLAEIQRDPAKHLDDGKLQVALASQAGLAHFDMPEAGITPMSLNTAKRAADVVLGDRGYSQLDRLRRDCAEALEATRAASRSEGTRETKRSLKERARAAEDQIDLLSEDLQLAVGLLRDCLRQGRAYAKRADAATLAVCEKEQRDILRALGLLRTPPR
jgi:hypothetical protein